MSSWKTDLKEFLLSHDFLVRINLLFIAYLGWIIFGIAYPVLGKWSVNLTPYLLKLPLTSKHFVLILLSVAKLIPGLWEFLKIVYYLGFSGAIALETFYILLLKRDLNTFDRLLASYVHAYLISGFLYIVAHVYAPHVVYGLTGYPPEGILTREEFVLPSLHNAFALINVLFLWRYRNEFWALVLIVLNGLVPPATVLLAHHWIYDVLSGFLVAILAFNASKGFSIQTERFKIKTGALLRTAVIFSIIVLMTLVLSVLPTPSYAGL